jgi:hypothetical protein
MGKTPPHIHEYIVVEEKNGGNDNGGNDNEGNDNEGNDNEGNNVGIHP